MLPSVGTLEDEVLPSVSRRLAGERDVIMFDVLDIVSIHGMRFVVVSVSFQAAEVALWR